MKTIRAQPKLRECQTALEDKYPTVSTFTLGSIFNSYVQRKMKLNHSRHNTPDKIKYYYEKYLKAVESKEVPGIILRMADEIEICPVLVARFILEAYLKDHQESVIQKFENDKNKEPGKMVENMESTTEGQSQALASSQPVSQAVIRSEINRLLRDTTQIDDRDLAYEVYLCTIHDDHYGPMPDTIKQSIGQEYELILKDKLDELGVTYVPENDLRQHGFDKTPDFKLETPIAIEGRVVNWIESKALFGDEETHQTYLKEQLMSYMNRFGPGLVLYFLGFVDTLEANTVPGIFIRDHFPNSVVFLNPKDVDTDLSSRMKQLDMKVVSRSIPVSNLRLNPDDDI